MGKIDNNFDKFIIWRYPVFFISLGYIYLEMSNPILAAIFQVIPKIPNSAFFILLCYFITPRFIKIIRTPLDISKISYPFLIVACINIPFIIYEQDSSIVQLGATIFYMVFLMPLVMKIFEPFNVY